MPAETTCSLETSLAGVILDFISISRPDKHLIRLHGRGYHRNSERLKDTILPYLAFVGAFRGIRFTTKTIDSEFRIRNTSQLTGHGSRRWQWNILPEQQR